MRKCVYSASRTEKCAAACSSAGRHSFAAFSPSHAAMSNAKNDYRLKTFHLLCHPFSAGQSLNACKLRSAEIHQKLPPLTLSGFWLGTEFAGSCCVRAEKMQHAISNRMLPAIQKPCMHCHGGNYLLLPLYNLFETRPKYTAVPHAEGALLLAYLQGNSGK